MRLERHSIKMQSSAPLLLWQLRPQCRDFHAHSRSTPTISTDEPTASRLRCIANSSEIRTLSATPQGVATSPECGDVAAAGAGDWFGQTATCVCMVSEIMPHSTKIAALPLLSRARTPSANVWNRWNWNAFFGCFLPARNNAPRVGEIGLSRHPDEYNGGFYSVAAIIFVSCKADERTLRPF